MDRREEFVLRALDEETNKSELCREFGVSRKTGYKWLRRFLAKGLLGLDDMSRRPHRSPLQASGDVVAEVVRLRRLHRTWGPRKLVCGLRERFPAKEIPTLRTLARILTRTGLVEQTRRLRKRRRLPKVAAPRLTTKAPNDLWTVDFKGWWRTRNGRRCEPLTVRDAHSRFLLELRAMPSTSTAAVRSAFEALFRRWGLPKAILMDNGTPWVSAKHPLGLSELSVWWMSLGIRIIRTRVGHPQDNGAHERVHADIRAELQDYAELDLESQQRAFDRWRHVFNHHRPHEALRMKTPVSVFRASPRRFSSRQIHPVYPDCYEVRTVGVAGHIKYQGHQVFVSGVLRGQQIGLAFLPNGAARVWYFDVCLGALVKVRRGAMETWTMEWSEPRRKRA